ncbi:nucleotide exchange factor GrpE [Gleimia sp. 6138-11-ORH1]|uniref:nucleotide exchange factor GrpE n=1 Tax=Gleimia sp. 6138-11-ORH1 TaxID=2973937 RepID=UPI0021670AA9|nr:nucleotide exchange factor GrpE [Gleimia sp. 6138-11-ORH1]MCS4484826.1 nucleotide exchange factor GrpE [Gleimia sp. 6138-11-ORH1]
MENNPQNPEEEITPVEETEGEDIAHLAEQLADVEIPEAEPTVEQRLEALEQENAQLHDDLARARADLYNLDQQYNNYVRRSKADQTNAKAAGKAEVIEALLPVLDDIEAARAAGELESGPFAAIATKFEQLLENRYQFARFGTNGDTFDPQFHEAVMATPSSEVEVETVQQVIQSGYQLGETTIRPAKVIVANPQ